jgi:hypothetical protein
MTNFTNIASAILAFLAITTFVSSTPVSVKGNSVIVQDSSIPIIDQTTQDKELGDFVMKLMTVSGVKHSIAKKEILARTFVRVANEIFKDNEQKKGYAIVVTIESAWNPEVGSTAGAVGLSQIMPQYAKSFGTQCGITGLSDADYKDPEINLLLGACLFRSLIENLDNTALALAAYNAGVNSGSVKDLAAMRTIKVQETASYIAKYMFVQEKVERMEKATRLQQAR